MRVVERLARREESWRELDAFLQRIEGAPVPIPLRAPPPRKREEIVFLDGDGRPPPGPGPARPSPRPFRRGKLNAEEVLRVGELYRAACADLMLAEAYDLPRDTVAFLHDLVARAHNAVYRGRGFRFRSWAKATLAEVPRQLRRDKALRVAAAAFWGPFLVAMLLAAGRPDPEFADKLVGAQALARMESDFSTPIGERADRQDAAMAGFYIQHNAGIGLSCFAWGITLVATLYILVTNGLDLGAAFGHMTKTPYWGNFSHFVTAHGPFELTAIVFSGAAGLRIGYALIDTRGRTRLESLRREALAALPTMGVAVVLFVLAAFLEGFVSASSLPYAAKAGIAAGSALLLVLYVALGGRGRVGDEDQEEAVTRDARQFTLTPALSRGERG